jgi:DNA-binding NtrC family response regulator
VQARLLALVTLAVVLYVVASIAAASVPIDGAALLAIAVALGCALTPVWLARDGSDTGAPSVAWLGMLLGVALTARISLLRPTLLGELLAAVSLPAVGLTLARLALERPDRPRALARLRLLAPLLALLAGLAGVAGALAALPPVWLSDRTLIAPPTWVLVPPVALAALALFAVLLRLSRRLFGSDAHALAANLWASMGSGAALVATAVTAVLALTRPAERSWILVASALAALFWLAGHVAMVRPAQVLTAGASARRLLALTVALAVAIGWVVWASAALPLASWASTLSALALFLFVHVLATRFAESRLPPDRGRLLRALRDVRASCQEAVDYEELASRVLKPLRRAARLPEASPLLATFEPRRVAQLDAAGHARLHPGRELPAALQRKLEQSPGEIVVTRDLRATLVRRPDQVSLVRALEELDALCVVPMRFSDALEAALIVARGRRRAPLTLEELLALEELAHALAPQVAGFASLERTRRRAECAEAEQRSLTLRLEQQTGELEELRAQLSGVKARLGLPLPVREPVHYAPAMRALLGRLREQAVQDLPLLLQGEEGTDFAALAQAVHRASGRAQEPLVWVDGAGLGEEGAYARLFGSGDAVSHAPGVLELVGRGTVLVLDLPAVPLAIQRALANAIAERELRSDHGVARPFQGRIIVTARRELGELVHSGALVKELARWLERTAHWVPPLRERSEDFESLLLFALDRAARVSGKSAKGIDEEALRVLLAHDFPGNEAELAAVLERAFLRARGARITVADLDVQLAPARARVTGTWADQERAILARVLRQTGGNRSRAARMLGLSRTELEEKLRRASLERAKRDN